MTCLPPYSNQVLVAGQSCFICNAANCAACDPNNPSSCIQCSTGYNLNNGSCVSSCSQTTCLSCPTGSSVCQTCANFLYLNPFNQSCQPCPNSPACLNCNPGNPSLCLKCNTGFFLNSNNTCTPCPIFCSACNSAIFCTALVNPMGFTLVQVSPTMTALAMCNTPCLTCSSLSPNLCQSCLPGFYLSSVSTSTIITSNCLPCTLSSQCKTCSASAPNVCLSCWAGAFLTSNSVCSICSVPCTSCLATNTSFCTSCPSGFSLTVSSGICTILTSSSTGCTGVCANCQTNGNTSTCVLCINGYVLNSGQCTPCLAGCSVCSPGGYNLCLACSDGNYLNSTGFCVACATNCASCSAFGCS